MGNDVQARSVMAAMAAVTLTATAGVLHQSLEFSAGLTLATGVLLFLAGALILASAIGWVVAPMAARTDEAHDQPRP